MSFPYNLTPRGAAAFPFYLTPRKIKITPDELDELMRSSTGISAVVKPELQGIEIKRIDDRGFERIYITVGNYEELLAHIAKVMADISKGSAE